jgi:hypothetical protein
MTDQIPLFVDTYEEAIRHTINALKGFKAVGVALWPDKTADAAGRRLADCLNADKPDRLNPSELAFIRRWARSEGVHVMATYELRAAGYADPQPIEPEDERARLQREYVAAVRTLTALTQKLGVAA